MKTWAMRGTLHLLAPEDAGAYLALRTDLRGVGTPELAAQLRSEQR
jgi:hypothetical protein